MAVITGTNGPDALFGTPQDDTIAGLGGNDLLSGGDGNDTLTGDGGNDILYGENGSDRLLGGAGDDILSGGAGQDVFDGGEGNDWIIAGFGNKVASGGAGVDTLVMDAAVRTTSFFATGNPATTSATVNFTGIESFEFVDGRYTRDVGDIAAQALRLYQAALGRMPDAAGLSFHTANLEDAVFGRPGGLDLLGTARSFLASPEMQAHYGTLTDAAFVTQLYANVLHRVPDAAEVSFHVDELARTERAQVLLHFSESPENINNTRAEVEGGLWVTDARAAQVMRLYDTTLHRLPDSGGLSEYTADLKGGQTLDSVAYHFTASPEFTNTYGALNDHDLVALLYRNTLHREGTETEISYYTHVLATQAMTQNQVVVAFSESPEHVQLTAASLTDHGMLLG